MRHALSLVLIAGLALAGCKAKQPEANATEESGEPQVATSIEDYGLPVDKSDQISSIDAATGDASGMPKDGGAVVQAPRHEASPTSPAAPAAENAQAPAAAAPPARPAPPAFTIEDVPGTK